MTYKSLAYPVLVHTYITIPVPYQYHTSMKNITYAPKANDPSLIREFYDRGEWISSSPNSGLTSAHAMLKAQPGYPFKDDRKGKDDCIQVFRTSDREKLLIREKYQTQHRNTAERWLPTDKADELLKWQTIVRDELTD